MSRSRRESGQFEFAQPLGDVVDQLEMFADPLSQPARAAARPVPRTEFTEFPDSLIMRLRGELRRMERAQFMWLTPDQLTRETSLFLGCIRRLPPDRRGDLAERWTRELARLGCSAQS